MKKRQFRDWKTFNERWGRADRLYLFLGGSGMVHLLLALLFGAPIYFARQYQQQAELRQRQAKEEKEKEVEKAVEETSQEIRETLKEEMALEQLRSFFSDLTGEFLPEDLAGEYWDDLMEFLDPEMEELADLMESTDSLARMKAEELIQKMKEKMLEKLSEMAMQGHKASLREELLAKAREIARQLAEYYRAELGQKVGRPIGENFAQLLKNESDSLSQKLPKTGPETPPGPEGGARDAPGLRNDALEDPFLADLIRMLNQLRRGKLSAHVRGQFDELYEQKALPSLLQMAGESVGKRLQAERVAPDALQAEILAEMARIFGKDTQEAVDAGETVAEAASEAFPHGGGPHGPEKGGTKAASSGVPGASDGDTGEGPETGAQRSRIAALAAGAEKNAVQLADQSLAAILESGLHRTRASLALLHHGSEESGDGMPILLDRLDNLKKQLEAGRKDFLGQPASTGVAAARRRHQRRRGSLRRLGSYGDVDAEAYRKIVETLRDRGQITGEEFFREAASGEVSTATAENTLRPAFISAAEPPPQPPGPETPQERKVQPPTFKTNRFTGIPFLAEDVIKIDGDLSDWKGLPTLEMDPILKGQNPGSVRPAHQTGYLAYCAQGLLVAVDAIDTTQGIEDHKPLELFWLNDCLEIFVDTLNTKYSVRGELNTHQFFAYPFGAENSPEPAGYEAQIVKIGEDPTWKRVPYSQEVMPRVARKTEQGWTLEILVPKTLLRHGQLKPGQILGFNLQLDTGSDLYYYWTCASRIISSQHPNTWGDIQVLGSDARVEAVGEDSKKSIQALSPGEPVRIRVTDPDMNLDDLRKDKVSLTLRADSGDMETMILEETENRSGVFLGAISTQLSVGTPQPGLFEIFEGETVTAEYLDQARAYGERNIPLQAVFSISSLGMKVAD